MKNYLLCSLILTLLITSCSDTTYKENLKQSEWIELYENISLSENIETIKEKFPAITDWATEEKDKNVYIWTTQNIFDAEAPVAFIFKDDTLYQVKIYLRGLSEGDAEKVFHSIKSKYTNSISSNKHFCNNENSKMEACFWLLESMTVYLKYIEEDKPLILFGFQKR